MKKLEKLVLIDAHALIHRAYHALPPLTSKNGQMVNAVYGFALVLLKILKDLKPDYLVAAFDRPEPTFRHKEFKEYKAQRPKAKPELISQFKLTRKLVEVFSIPIYEKSGYEADDVIASLVTKSKKRNIIVTSDLDALQLVDSDTEVLTLKKGVSETVLYNREAVQERFGLKPEQLIDFKALKGDSSDNIPGLPGIGDKTAASLLQEYANLENIYKNLIHIKKPKVKEILEKNKNLAFFNKKLVTLRRDLDLNFDLKKANAVYDRDKVIEFFKELGFYSLVERMTEQKGDLSAPPLFKTNANDPTANPMLKNRLSVPQDSIEIAAYLLNPGQRDYSGERLLLQYSAKDQEELKEILEKKLKEENLWNVYTKIELPLMPVLRQMEKNGIKVDKNILKKLQKNTSAEVKQKEKEIYKKAGIEFNINSPSQLSKILFERMQIPIKGLRKTPKGVISTKASELEKLKDKHEIISLISDYRELSKLKTTYLDALPKFIDKKTDRIHTTFLQTGTATGRLASENPNLQNIPEKIKKIFIAEKNYKLVSFDYSQLELRLAAHLSQDPKMLMAFRDGLDIHSLTAAELNISRNQAKTLNFGVLYGMGAQGFAETAKISKDRAEQFIREYFHNFKKLSEWIVNIKAETREQGYAKTLTGRRRYLPDITSSNFQLRSAAERMAVNMSIQGLAADIIKIAMIQISGSLTSRDCRMLLQIHDELLFEIKDDIIEKSSMKIKNIMEKAFPLSVALKVNISL